MTNQAWECPRCHRINAPFNPTCFCGPEKGLQEEQKNINEITRSKEKFAPPEFAAELPYGLRVFPD